MQVRLREGGRVRHAYINSKVGKEGRKGGRGLVG